MMMMMKEGPRSCLVVAKTIVPNDETNAVFHHDGMANIDAVLIVPQDENPNGTDRASSSPSLSERTTVVFRFSVFVFVR